MASSRLSSSRSLGSPRFFVSSQIWDNPVAKRIWSRCTIGSILFNSVSTTPSIILTAGEFGSIFASNFLHAWTSAEFPCVITSSFLFRSDWAERLWTEGWPCQKDFWSTPSDLPQRCFFGNPQAGYFGTVWEPLPRHVSSHERRRRVCLFLLLSFA